MDTDMLADIDSHFRQTAQATGEPHLSPALREALRRVRRADFVPAERAGHAQQDSALPIGCGQTISQPFIVALMTQLLALQPCDRVLDIGTGSGYQAAILAELVASVYSLEVIPELALQARQRLSDLGYGNVQALEGDGWHGLPDFAPYDAIVVAAVVEVPPPELLRQLAPGGRMVLPLGSPHGPQHLVLVEKLADGQCRQRQVLPVSFVPFTRAH